MKTNKLLTKKSFLIVNIILFVLILAIIVLGFGEMFTVTNLSSISSISFLDYAFKTHMSNHLSYYLKYNVIYILGFVFLITAICMTVTMFALTLTGKRIKKLEISLIISIIFILVVTLLLSLLSKFIYLSDLKHIHLVTPSQLEKLWERGKIGDGAICMAVFSVITLAPASLTLYISIKTK